MSKNINNKERTRQEDENDSDSDYDMYENNFNFPRFLVVSSASEELPLKKLSPFAIQKAFIGIAGNGLKSTKKLRDGSFLTISGAEVGNRSLRKCLC